MSDPVVEGVKDDELKLKWHLLPWRPLEEVVGVLMYGAEKYGENNWRAVKGSHHRYFNAAIRHLTPLVRGQSHDPETGFHHLAHAICCLLFMLAPATEGREFDYNYLRRAIETARRLKAEREAGK